MEAFIWYGGTFSPPVKEHIRIIKAIVEKACHLHPTGKITLAVVPVHADYPSSKVQRECILPEERLALCQTLVTAAKSEIKSERVTLTLEDRDIKSNQFYSAYESVRHAPNARTVYLALRERNMIEILKRLWDNSNELLQKCSFLVFANEKDTDIRNKEKLRQILATDYSRREYRPSKGSFPRDSTDSILKKIHVLDGEFTDGKCGEKVREMLMGLSDLFHPLIFKKFMEIGSKRANIYQSPICEREIAQNTYKNKSRQGRSSRSQNKSRKNK